MITDQVTLLNDTVLECINENDEAKIFKAFVEVGIKILGADYGFAWLLKDFKSRELQLVYKSPNLPFIPTARKDGRNYSVIKTRIPIFISSIRKTPDVNYVSKYFTSYAIIPLVHQKVVHGSMVICFKKQEQFHEEKKALAVLLGNSAAQALTINRLILSEQEAAVLKEKHKSTDMLLAQEKLKTEFIANTTHELRTPLAIIRGYVELGLLKNKKASKETVDMLNNINKEVVHLSQMLSDLVLITTEKNSKEKSAVLEKKSVNVIGLLEEIVRRMNNIAKKQGISMEIKKRTHEATVKGDGVQLEKLFLNLVKNAISYGNSKINITISKEKEKIIVEVADNGIGISKEDLPNIFERFYRGDKAHTGGRKHSGLGLSIVKWITEMHGGRIEVESTEGMGSTFTVTLPQGR